MTAVLTNLNALRPIKARVIIRPDEPPATTASGLIAIPETVRASMRTKEKGERRKASWGTVIAVGPGDYDVRGRFYEPEVVAGDRVLVNDVAPKELYKGPDGEDIYATWHWACVAIDEDTPVRQRMRKEQ